MPEYVMRVEGVNFAATITDTQNLSCIRGASLAFLHAGQRMEWLLSQQDGVSHCVTIFKGASQAAFRFRANETAATEAVNRIRQALETEGDDADSHLKVLKLAAGAADSKEWEGAIPLAHLSFVVDVVEAGNSDDAAIDTALALVEARNHAHQYQSLTVRLPKMDRSERAQWPDDLGRILPADSKIWLPPDSVTPLPGEDEPKPDDKAQKTKMSRSVAARRHYGRHMRQFFYQSELDRDFKEIRFTDSIESICDHAPLDVPEAIRNKIAIVSIDGNKFGKIRDELALTMGKANAVKHFSERLRILHRELLTQIMDRLIGLQGDGDRETMKRGWVYVEKKNGRALRFETLRWAGDDIVWVVPSWLAFWLIEAFFTLSRSWAIDQHPLTHAAGIVLCDRKTPIRQATAMADKLVKRAKSVLDKNRQCNVVQVEVFESADLPVDGNDDHRRALYPGLSDQFKGIERPEEADGLMAATFTLPAERIGAVIDMFEEPFQDNPSLLPTKGLVHRLPRSQIYRLLRRAIKERAFGGGVADQNIKGELVSYLAGSGANSEFDMARLDFWQGTDVAWKYKPHRSLALTLALVAQYWDYAVPFDGKVRPPKRFKGEDHA